MTRLTNELRNFERSLESLHQRHSRSSRDAKRHELLDLVEHGIASLARALLEDLNVAARQEDRLDDLIDKASGAVRERRDRFAEDAPVQFFAQRIEELREVIRDIGYLREGFGVGSDQPRPADMKLTYVSAVEGYVLDVMTYVASELNSDSADIHVLKPEADLNLSTVREGIVALLEQDLGAAAFMDAVIDLGNRLTDVVGWDAYRDIPYERELGCRSDFFVEVVEREPPAKPLTGFGVEIAYPSRGGDTTADLLLMGGSAYQPNDETWLDVQEYTPREHAADSEVLAAIYRLAYAPGGLGNAADYTLCLAWSAYFARACARRFLNHVGRDFIGVRVGFGGGDWIDLGWVRRLTTDSK